MLTPDADARAGRGGAMNILAWTPPQSQPVAPLRPLHSPRALGLGCLEWQAVLQVCWGLVWP